MEIGYIEIDGHIFTPRKNIDGTVSTAEEVCQEWMSQKDSPLPPSYGERIEALESALLEVILNG